MNWGNVNWEMYGAAVTGLTLIYAMLRNFKKDILYRFERIDKQFDKVDSRFERVDSKFDKIESRFDRIDSRFDRIDNQLKEIRGDISEVKERLTYLEAANIYTMPLEPSKPNPRSLKAKEMWVRRKQKKVDNKEGT